MLKCYCSIVIGKKTEPVSQVLKQVGNLSCFIWKEEKRRTNIWNNEKWSKNCKKSILASFEVRKHLKASWNTQYFYPREMEKVFGVGSFSEIFKLEIKVLKTYLGCLEKYLILFLFLSRWQQFWAYKSAQISALLL